MIDLPETPLGEIADDLTDAILRVTLEAAFRIERARSGNLAEDDETRSWPLPQIYRTG